MAYLYGDEEREISTLLLYPDGSLMEMSGESGGAVGPDRSLEGERYGLPGPNADVYAADSGSRDEDPGDLDDATDRGGNPDSVKHSRLRSIVRSSDELEFNEVNIHIKVSYKTLLLVFVLFDVSHRLINAIVNN